MTEKYDPQKIIDIMFDPVISQLLAQLEDGEKNLSFLSKVSTLSAEEVVEKFSYLCEHDFVIKRSVEGITYYSANAEKLSQVVESHKNFDDAIDGLTKMDSYLN